MTDLLGYAAGWGYAIHYALGIVVSGTWLNDKPEGIMLITQADTYKAVTEYYQGKEHGRSTDYFSGSMGCHRNMLMVNGL